MKLIGLSILLGSVGPLLIYIFYINGIEGSREFAFIMWTIGFFSPSIYVLDKLYKEIKNKTVK